MNNQSVQYLLASTADTQKVRSLCIHDVRSGYVTRASIDLSGTQFRLKIRGGFGSRQKREVWHDDFIIRRL